MTHTRRDQLSDRLEAAWPHCSIMQCISWYISSLPCIVFLVCFVVLAAHGFHTVLIHVTREKNIKLAYLRQSDN